MTRTRYNHAVRRLLTILQLLLLVVPTFWSAFSGMNMHGNDESNLPVCCRRSGAHHCAIAASQRVGMDGSLSASAIPQHCNYFPKGLPVIPHAPVFLAPSAVYFSQILSHPACSAQTLARLRIARDRSRQKRGPPVLG